MLLDDSFQSMRDDRLFVFLEKTPREDIVPFITFESAPDWMNFRIYALLTRLNLETDVEAFVIRFEGPESGTSVTEGAHNYYHAQLCNEINGIRELTTQFFSDSQLAFNLDAEDAITLVLCMLVSIYGARHVLQKLNGIRSFGLRDQLRRVKALSPDGNRVT